MVALRERGDLGFLLIDLLFQVTELTLLVFNNLVGLPLNLFFLRLQLFNPLLERLNLLLFLTDLFLKIVQPLFFVLLLLPDLLQFTAQITHLTLEVFVFLDLLRLFLLQIGNLLLQGLNALVPGIDLILETHQFFLGLFLTVPKGLQLLIQLAHLLRFLLAGRLHVFLELIVSILQQRNFLFLLRNIRLQPLHLLLKLPDPFLVLVYEPLSLVLQLLDGRLKGGDLLVPFFKISSQLRQLLLIRFLLLPQAVQFVVQLLNFLRLLIPCLLNFFVQGVVSVRQVGDLLFLLIDLLLELLDLPLLLIDHFLGIRLDIVTFLLELLYLFLKVRDPVRLLTNLLLKLLYILLSGLVLIAEIGKLFFELLHLLPQLLILLVGPFLFLLQLQNSFLEFVNVLILGRNFILKHGKLFPGLLFLFPEFIDAVV